MFSKKIIEIIDTEMSNHPKYWDKHYQGEKNVLKFARKYSYSDRIRYYWPNERINKALDRLIENLSTHLIPLSLLSQYLPIQYRRVREGQISNLPKELISDKIKEVLTIYSDAISFGVGAKEAYCEN